MGPRYDKPGFTLMEVLVALAVFAIIGLLGAQLMGRTLDNHAIVGERTDRLAEVQRAMLMLKRDLMQITGRPVRDLLGDARGWVLIGSDGLLEFSRMGWRNPLRQRRAEVQRVAYLTEDGDLYRVWWNVLDRAPDSVPTRQRLLSGIEQVEFVALDASGREHAYWPPLQEADSPGHRLAAIVMRLEFEPFGVVERVWPVPGIERSLP